MKTTALILIISLFGSLLKQDNPVKPTENTQVISQLEEKIDLSKNIVYASTFRASWTMLKENVISDNVIVNGAYQFGTMMNKSPYHPSTEDWVVEAGFVEDGVLNRIDNSLQTKFGIRETDLDQFEDERDAIICYSYFQKALTFKYPFESLEWEFKSNGESYRVACLGVSKSGERDQTEELKARNRQVTIFDYRNPDDFIVRLVGKEENKEIILAKVHPAKTLKETMITVLVRMQLAAPEELIFLDELVIPKINLEIEHSYDELLGKFLANPGFKEYFFARASQDINFSLDETGAQGSATGEIVKIKGPTSTLYHFDKPFLVIMKDKDQAEPDLVMWIANAEYLAPVN